MNRDAFLARLRYNLGNVRPDILDDIISDFEEHFLVASESGTSEEEICAILGDPDDIARQYLEEMSGKLNCPPVSEKSEKQPRENEFDEDGIKITRRSENYDGMTDIKIPFPSLDDIPPIPPIPPIPDMKGRIIINDNVIELGDIGEYVRKQINEKVFDKIQKSLTRTFSGADFDDKDFDDDDEGKEYRDFDDDDDVNFPGSEIKSITLDFKNSNIRAEKSDSDNIMLEFISGSEKRPAITVLNTYGRLTIRDSYGVYGRKGRGSCENCIIMLPESFKGEMSCKTVSGDISLDGLRSEAPITVRTISGDISINNCEADISPNCVSGGISISGLVIRKKGENAGSMTHTISTSSGDVKAAGLVCVPQCAINTVSGNIEIVDSKADLKLRTGSGNIDIDGLLGDAYTNAGSGDIKIKDHKGNVSGGTGSGNIEVSTFRLDKDTSFSTSSGNIRLSAKEVAAPLSLSSSVGVITIKIDRLTDRLRASTTLGDIKAKFGKNQNLRFEIDAESIKTHRERVPVNTQLPEVIVSLKARRGKVLLDDLD